MGHANISARNLRLLVSLSAGGLLSMLMVAVFSPPAFAGTLPVKDSCSAVMGWESNLIANGDAEANLGANDAITVVTPDCWNASSSFTAVRYGVSGFPISGTVPNGGANFFAGGPNSAVSTATQVIDISVLSPTIDSGSVIATLSGFLGGYAQQADHMAVVAEFRTGTQQTLGQIQIGPLTVQERANATTLYSRSTSGVVPVGTRQVALTIKATRAEGTYDDGYADNLSLILDTCTHTGPVQLDTNLLINGDGESDFGTRNDASAHPISCWSTTPNFTSVRYGADAIVTEGSFPLTDTVPTGGMNFFAGGLNTIVSTATQVIDVSAIASALDSGAYATLSAFLGGSSADRDHMAITATFLSASRQPLGTIQIGPVTTADRANTTQFLFRSASLVVPTDTRYIEISMVATRFDSLYNDGYADNLSFAIHEFKHVYLPLISR